MKITKKEQTKEKKMEKKSYCQEKMREEGKGSKEQQWEEKNGSERKENRARKHVNCSLFSYLTDVFVLSAASIHCFPSVVGGQ